MARKRIRKKVKARIGRPPHEPTAENRMTVHQAALVGTDQETIAGMIGINRETLAKHYAYELHWSAAKANINVGGTAYLMATGGGGPDGWRNADFQAVKFWLQTRAHWKQDAMEFSGPNGGPIQTQDASAKDIILAELARLAGRANKDDDEKP